MFSLRLVYIFALMIFKFISLQWKAFFRSASLGGNMITKVFTWFGMLYFIFMATLLGLVSYKLLTKDFAVENPLLFINKQLIYAFAYWIVIRYFAQKPPVLNIRALLITPVSKTQIVRYALNKSIFSFFNVIALFYLIPFSLLLLKSGNYEPYGLLSWNLAVLGFVYITHYLNILINSNNKIFYSIAVGLALIKGLEYFAIFDFTIYSQALFYSFYETPLLALLPWTILIFVYYRVFVFFKKGLYIDTGLQVKVKEATFQDYTWLNRFGKLSTFLKNDLRLIVRSKRARGTVLGGVFFLFYGFIFIFQEDTFGSFMTFFAYMFSSGGFLFMFGGFVPSWDSQYYPLMMCQNIHYNEYLKSKWSLIVLATIVSTFLASAMYSFQGIEAVCAVVAGGLYNIGVNGYLTLWAGAYTKSPIDLNSNKNPFGDTKAVNMKTLLITLPQIVLPVLVYFLGSHYFNTLTGCAMVGLIGVLGLTLKNKIFQQIVKTYKAEKYSTLNAYKQNS